MSYTPRMLHTKDVVEWLRVHSPIRPHQLVEFRHCVWFIEEPSQAVAGVLRIFGFRKLKRPHTIPFTDITAHWVYTECALHYRLVMSGARSDPASPFVDRYAFSQMGEPMLPEPEKKIVFTEEMLLDLLRHLKEMDKQENDKEED